MKSDVGRSLSFSISVRERFRGLIIFRGHQVFSLQPYVLHVDNALEV